MATERPLPWEPRAAWEAQIIAGSVALVSVVVAVCLSVGTVAALLYGLAYLREHWPEA